MRSHQRPSARTILFARAAVLLAALLAILVASMAGLAAAQSRAPLSYDAVLGQLTDLDRLTRLQTGCRGGLFSSWDRNGRTAWGANGDAGQYLRVEPNGEAVMMELDGPGVIYRVWSANPMGKLRLYLDGAARPDYEWNFPDLFDGRTPPFVKPLVYRRDAAQSASDCYLPIPFAKHIKITADKAHGQYYHFNYVTFPKDRPVASFRLPLADKEQAALAAVVEAWSHPGRDPKPSLAGQTKIARSVVIEPGQTATLCELSSPGVIRSIRARVKSEQRYAWRKLVLCGQWDGAAWPQVLTPLGPFFGFDFDAAQYGSVVAGCRAAQAYQFFPMPFGKSAKLSLVNYLEAPATVEYEIQWAPLAQLPADAVYFFARWRHEPDATTFDYPFIETAGRGHFVGVAMPIEHPLPGWWGEGDEKVWVDDDDYPPYIGTGSEDYFGDAWGIRYLSGPSFGASSMNDRRTCNYRWHFADFIPFAKRMRMTIENYGPNGIGPRGQYDYSSTAFWYQAELTPPFAQLRGVRYTGGDDPAARPGPAEYRTDVFAPVTAESVRTYGLGVTFARQAETLLADAVKAGRAKIVTDARRPYQFDRERAVDFGEVDAGRVLAAVKLRVDADSVYSPRLFTAPQRGMADLTLVSGGKRLPIVGRPQPHVLQLGGLFLSKGEHAMELTATTAGRGLLDCLQLEPAPRRPGALEAEEFRVLRATGGDALPKPSEPVNGASAGRVLEFSAAREGQGFVLDLGKRPALPYVLGVRPWLGPDGAIVRAFTAEGPIGPRFDLHAKTQGLGPSILPLGAVPSNAREIEIRVVGASPESTGKAVRLDYFRWEPALLGPGSAEGVWLHVLATHRCEYSPQDLGGNYSDGHQFWVQPSDRNAWVDVAVEIPRAGQYELIVKYTKSWDYAKAQAYLDGKPLGPVVDTYAENVIPAEPLALGTRELAAGRHVLRFQAVGKNAASRGYLMGIDHVIVK